MDFMLAEGKKKLFGEIRRNAMSSAKFGSRGFTLIAALLLTLLLSGFAVALLMMVNTEQKVGAADLSNNYTYRAAEGAMEKMTSDLASTFQNIQAPTAAQICAVSNTPPTWDPTITFTGQDGAYNVTPVTPGVANPCVAPLSPVWGPIQSGPDAGLYAQIIPVTMNVTAQRILGNAETVSMTRTAEVALIPVFQFGVFCDGDCFFGRSPNLGFAGRVHTNGDLYLGVADGYNLVFGDKISAFGNVIREQMDNGVASAGNDNGGTVMIPTTSNGCSAQMANVAAAVPSATCVDISTTPLGATNGSVNGGHASTQVPAWYNVSLGTPYNSYIIDGNGTLPGTTNGPNGTGASDLTLPFVNGTTFPFQIIRRPPPGETTTSLLGGSRLANEAQIRILLSDKEADLHLPGWNGDVTQDVELASAVPASEFVNTAGPFTTTGGAQSGIPVNGNYYYFGESACGAGALGSACTNGDTSFVWPPWVPGGTTAAHNVTQAEWPIINGWLLVEVLNSTTGLWTGVTKEWLQLGFARGLQVPTAPGSAAGQATNTIGATGSNFLTDHKNAILYFQMTADRNGNGSVTAADAITFNSVFTGGSVTTTPLVNYGTALSSQNSQYNWYPINLYDAREGENNDVSQPVGTGTVNGIMNCVELDVGNLRRWLLGLTGATGNTVNFTTQNGYVLYFSDRRGMQYDPNLAHNPSNILLGAYGFEDVVNYAAGSPFAPNGTLEPANYNGVSPEDTEQWNDGTVTTYGVVTVGDAFGNQTKTDTDVTNPHNPFAHRINTFTVGRANRVTGARHALKLVDGSLGNLPTMPPGNASNNCAQTAANPTACGGFTVGSENPVYIQGNYNSNCTAAGADCTPGNANYDPTWNSPPGAEPIHAASAVIADAVTVLSNNWQDAGWTGALYSGSLVNPINPSGQSVPAITPNRIAVTSYYRVAIAGGKNIAFTNTAQNPEFAFGMDGGIHNFLRFLEDWGGQASQQSLNYKGSLVSLYYATYATGTFKCCNLVYNPPNRNYVFDPLFAQPQNLPPGTPMFRNVDNLSYRQNQVARIN
jgi:Tfp pilus assembly protein PilX